MTVLPLPTFLNPTCPFRTVLHRTDSVLDSQTCTNLRNVSSNLHKTAEFVIGPGARPFVVCVHMESDFWVLEAPCVSCLPSSAHLLRHPYVSSDPGSEAVRPAPNLVHRSTPQPVPAHFSRCESSRCESSRCESRCKSSRCESRCESSPCESQSLFQGSEFRLLSVCLYVTCL